MLAIVDIVLNHTAHNSEWISLDPQATFNTTNCPHLWVAWEVDNSIQKFSEAFSRRQTPQCPSAPYIGNEGDLNSVMKAVHDSVIAPLKIEEFFFIDVATHLRSYERYIDSGEKGEEEAAVKRIIEENKYYLSDLKDIVNRLAQKHGHARFGVEVDVRVMAQLMGAKKNPQQRRAEFIKLLEQHNEQWRGKAKGFKDNILNSMRGEIHYHKLVRGKKRVDEFNELVIPYFRELGDKDNSKCVHNGWVMNINPKDDFTQGWYYLQRHVNAWGDSIKLRYGNNRENSPQLWGRM